LFLYLDGALNVLLGSSNGLPDNGALRAEPEAVVDLLRQLDAHHVPNLAHLKDKKKGTEKKKIWDKKRKGKKGELLVVFFKKNLKGH
jgi:hypothetical protein